jgi:hypothetical protein
VRRNSIGAATFCVLLQHEQAQTGHGDEGFSVRRRDDREAGQPSECGQDRVPRPDAEARRRAESNAGPARRTPGCTWPQSAKPEGCRLAQVNGGDKEHRHAGPVQRAYAARRRTGSGTCVAFR